MFKGLVILHFIYFSSPFSQDQDWYKKITNNQLIFPISCIYTIIFSWKQVCCKGCLFSQELHSNVRIKEE